MAVKQWWHCGADMVAWKDFDTPKGRTCFVCGLLGLPGSLPSSQRSTHESYVEWHPVTREYLV